MDKLYIIIPAYNEEMNIYSVAKEWHEVISEFGSTGSKLVIIDDGSKDKTYNILCKLKKNLPLLEPLTKINSGHGPTCLYGYHYAIENNADYIFQTASDGQTLPSEFRQFWEQRKEYSAIIGYRKRRQDGISRIFVTKVLKLVLKIIFGLNIPDANTPYRLMDSQILKKHLKKMPENFSLANILLTVSLMNAKENISFIPITFRPRQGGINSINIKKIIKIGIKAIKDFYSVKRIFNNE